jgi:hypothetical protein
MAGAVLPFDDRKVTAAALERAAKADPMDPMGPADRWGVGL